jgi:hypothetical protein
MQFNKGFSEQKRVLSLQKGENAVKTVKQLP